MICNKKLSLPKFNNCFDKELILTVSYVDGYCEATIEEVVNPRAIHNFMVAKGLYRTKNNALFDDDNVANKADV